MSAQNFEVASRLKLRFNTPAGPLSIEDLWDLPLSAATQAKANLDDLARTLHNKLKNAEDVSFVKKSTSSTPNLDQLRFDLVKYVIDTRMDEIEKAEKAASNKAKKQKLLAILEQKEDQSLMEASADDIRKMIESL